MSNYESHKGKIVLIETDLSFEEFAKQIVGNELPKYYDNFIEVIQDNIKKYPYYFHKSKIYKIENNEIDPGKDEFEFKQNEDKTIEYSFRFYNGGSCLNEQIEKVLSRINSID
jgi:hypothetical protein